MGRKLAGGMPLGEGYFGYLAGVLGHTADAHEVGSFSGFDCARALTGQRHTHAIKKVLAAFIRVDSSRIRLAYVHPAQPNIA
jgi:hypothetical protein